MYYIYIYLDPLKCGKFNYDDLIFNYEPFYVGRGKNLRYSVHLQKFKLKTKNEKNLRIKNILDNNLLPIINFYLTGISYEESLIIEKELILKIGRNKFNEGPLTNITSGGQGVSGIIMSDETKDKIRETCKKNGIYDNFSNRMKGESNPMYGDKWNRTEEGKISFNKKMSGISPWKDKTEKEQTIIHKKISKTLTGYKWDDIEKNKRSKGMKKVWRERKNKKISKKIIIFDINQNKEIEFDSMNKASSFLKISNWTLKNRYEKNKIVNNIKIKSIE